MIHPFRPMILTSNVHPRGRVFLHSIRVMRQEQLIGEALDLADVYAPKVPMTWDAKLARYMRLDLATVPARGSMRVQCATKDPDALIRLTFHGAFAVPC